jgi:RNA polymerase sigma-70 factor (ECF subfamily)
VDASAALVKVLREEGPRVLAALVRQLGDLPVAEDALSEASIAALGAWPASGIPDNPRAWLTVVARRKALDLLRRESARTDKETAAFRWGTERAKDEIEEVIDAMETESELRDDMLRLIFTCCHPALSREAQVALALRTLARLEVDAIARAFLVPEPTMAKRLVRARSKIATAHIPYVIPSDAQLPERLAAVLAVVYLIATEAHAPTGGNAVARVDLEAEAVRLARLLVELMPDEPEALSLLALLLFTSARTPARSDVQGHVVTLADQDRGRWNRDAIAEGSRWLSRAVILSGGPAGLYQLQAHLAAAHSTATSWSETDWTGSSGCTTCSGRPEPTRSWRSTGPLR